MLRTPKNLHRAMDLYRLGGAPLPEGYISFHARAARRDLLNRTDWRIVEDEGLTPDGWVDGFKTRTLTIAEKLDGKWYCHRIRWHESGAWFMQTANAWVRYAEMLPETRAEVEEARS